MPPEPGILSGNPRLAPGVAALPDQRVSRSSRDRSTFDAIPVPPARPFRRLVTTALTTAMSLAFLMAFVDSSVATIKKITLGELVDQSQNIVIGNVTSVTIVGGDGTHDAHIQVQENLLGVAPAMFTIRGKMEDDRLPEFRAGVKILAFLYRPSPPAPLTAVHGPYGVIELADGAVGVTRSIALKAIILRSALRLADVRDDLRRSPHPAPFALLGPLWEELTLRVTTSEATLVAEMACDPTNVFLPHARLWAISRVGPLGVSSARPCLEGMISGADPVQRIAAAEALGDLGDMASVPLLLTLIRPQLPFSLEPDTLDVSALGPENDPEDVTQQPQDPEQVAPPDSADDQPAGGNHGPHPGEPDGETEPDTAPSDDRRARQSDLGLTLAVVLALGKIGDQGAVSDLHHLAQEGDDLALHSTVVHALGLIGGQTVIAPLIDLSQNHPNEYVRDQAQRTLLRSTVAVSRNQDGAWALHHAVPNPFVRETRISFDLPARATVRLTVFDIAGRPMRTLVNGVQAAGPHSVYWDGRNSAGRRLAAGVYYCRLRSTHFAAVRALVLIE